MAAQAAAFCAWGSSPHTRGTRSRRGCASHSTWDHPRIRGEHDAVGAALHFIHGIIPAYAGNTAVMYRSQVAATGSSPHTRGTQSTMRPRHGLIGDHPRIRGEHRARHVAAEGAAGIIPAYAGNTSLASFQVSGVLGSSPHTRGTCARPGRWRACARDHPRIRGEHRLVALHPQLAAGIIPAYAGNTAMNSSPMSSPMGSSPHTRGTRECREGSYPRPWDHPRIRGEHRAGFLGPRGEAGIIPAYAGNTGKKPPMKAARAGSSPHTRGTPCRP